ncbi:hypothetical protein [Promineifilum sp.]|uniref:hypothetical protein n=1 Tax=Promineifilum sp. TaxID=2664178 RepID=UPI0031CCCF1C
MEQGLFLINSVWPVFGKAVHQVFNGYNSVIVVDLLVYLFLCVIPSLCILFLGYFALSKWAISKSPQQGASGNAVVESGSAVGNPPVPNELEQPTPRIQIERTLLPRPVASPQPKRKLDKKLRQQAKADYDTARGTAHLRLLQPAQETLQQRLSLTEKTLTARKQALANVANQWDTELRRVVVDQLVEAELLGVSGIGSRLATAIIQQVYHGNLNDLRFAQQVEGIGPQKQTAINTWLSNVEQRLPALLAASTPAQKEINARYEAERERLTREIALTEVARHEQSELLAQVNNEIAGLSAVSTRDFEFLLANPNADAEKVNGYLLGAFAPWEAMPDWFNQALEASQPMGHNTDVTIKILDR